MFDYIITYMVAAALVEESERRSGTAAKFTLSFYAAYLGRHMSRLDAPKGWL